MEMNCGGDGDAFYRFKNLGVCHGFLVHPFDVHYLVGRIEICTEFFKESNIRFVTKSITMILRKWRKVYLSSFLANFL